MLKKLVCCSTCFIEDFHLPIHQVVSYTSSDTSSKSSSYSLLDSSIHVVHKDTMIPLRGTHVDVMHFIAL